MKLIFLFFMMITCLGWDFANHEIQENPGKKKRILKTKCLPDSAYYFSIDTSRASSSNSTTQKISLDTMKEYFAYDFNDNLLTDLIRIKYNNNILHDSTKKIYTYDSNNNLITQIFQITDGNLLHDSTKTIFTYNSFNNPTTEINQRWNGTNWINYNRFLYSYNNMNKQILHIIQYWSSGNWVNSSKDSSVYDSKNKKILEIFQYGSSGSWINSYRDTLIYDLNGLESLLLRESWHNGSWSLSSKDTFIYNTDSLLINAYSVYGQTHSATYSYYPNKKLKSKKINAYLYSSSDNLTYDSYNYILTDFSCESVYGLGGRNNCSEKYYTYDSNHNILNRIVNSTSSANFTGTAYFWHSYENGVFYYPCINTGINSISMQMDLFPNPTLGNFTLKFSPGPTEVSIINSLGQTIQTYYVLGQTETNFNIEKEGLYFVKIKFREETIIKKLIVIK